jgi:hypothetical protein
MPRLGFLVEVTYLGPGGSVRRAQGTCVSLDCPRSLTLALASPRTLVRFRLDNPRLLSLRPLDRGKAPRRAAHYL